MRWTSGGAGDFEVERITRAARGTSVILHLRDDADDYLNLWKLKSIISKYSDHISLPILMEKEEWKEGEKVEGDDTGATKGGGMVATGEWEAVNKASALWTRPKKDVTDEQYVGVLQDREPRLRGATGLEPQPRRGQHRVHATALHPGQGTLRLVEPREARRVKLYVKRVFIMDDAESLLPTYLRFVKGVIDSADLPLNVSRELLQESRDVKSIREGSTKRVLSMLEDLARKQTEPATEAPATDDAGKYAKFYTEFGAVLKEGLGEDNANRERIARLLRFASTTSDAQGVSFADYKARMKDGQDTIYYITADTLAAAKNSPQLELFKKKGIEVLLMTDRVDEWSLNFMHEFEGTPLQSVAKGAVDLGKLQDDDEKKAAEAAAETFKPLLERLKAALKDKAEDVRVTTRLVDSPACLVAQDGGMSTQLARMLKQAGQPAPDLKPVLEVNAEHALVRKLEASEHFDDLANILFDQALLAEGGLPADPAAYVRRVNALLV